MEVVFEPQEYEVIETFEYEEDVQRPEELRFFTLDEQLVDYFQKALPTKKHIQKAEYAKINKEVERLRKLYENIVVLTDTDYRIKNERREASVPWLKSIYGKFEYEKFAYSERILPLREESARRSLNSYPVTLASLPRPYRSEGTEGVLVSKRTEFVDEEGKKGVEGLGNYVKQKRELRDDGTVRVLDVPVANTGDDIRRIGFYIEDRPLDIPHPLSDHPFLASSKSNKLLTYEPLMDVYPTIEAIMSHAVPTTTKPYSEGLKYLKVYDVRISEIPWKSWKERFPPADSITHLPVPSITFPDTGETVAPSESIQKVYDSKWPKSVNPRSWLMIQEDGGVLVSKMIMSDAGEFGMIAPDLVNDRPKIHLPESTPAECLKTDNFEEFLASGVFRSPGLCAPTAFVAQERQEFINKGKKAWTETTQTNIKRDYTALLKVFKNTSIELQEQKYESFKHTESSELRENIVIILKDDSLLPPDKSYNIRLLTKEITPVNNIFYDKNDAFLVCAHTLSQLDGDLEADRYTFYTKWTTTEDGARVCLSCGQEINTDNYVAQAQFDDNGKLVVSHDVIAGDTEGHRTVANSLDQLKNVFNLSNGGEAVMYFLLFELQVIPNESQLVPILGWIRKGSLAARKLPEASRNKFEGLLGLAGTVVLLQTHNPFLVPRRSFGNKVLKLSGFPRDTTDESVSPTLNLLLNILTELIESYPSGFTDPLATILREVAHNRKKTKDDCIKFIKQAYGEFKSQFESAKERAMLAPEPVDTNTLSLPTIIPKKSEYSPDERYGAESFSSCASVKPTTVIVGKLPPSLTQKFPKLWKTKPLNETYILPLTISFKYSFPDKKEIEKGVKIGISKTLKLELIRKFVDSDTDGVALSSLLSRMLDIVSVLKYPAKQIIDYRKFLDNLDSFSNKSLFRDAVKGKIYELVDSLKDGPLEAVRTAMTRDLDMNMILLTKEESEKQVEFLRSRERETLKERLRLMSDRDREATKMLLDIGISQYIVTNADRIQFAKELRIPEDIGDTADNPNDVPEGGNTTRDYFDEDAQMNEKGEPMDPDRGDYGDVRDRPEDDYSRTYDFDIEE